MERKKVGEVFHFYGKISVAAVRLTDGSIALGDTVQIQGPTTNVEQTVDTLQIEHLNVSRAEQGQEVGMKVRDRVRERDFVYKLLPPAEMATPPEAPPRKAPVVRKAPVKRGPVKRRPVRRKPAKRRPAKRASVKRATRGARSKARRGSRRSRRRSR